MRVFFNHKKTNKMQQTFTEEKIIFEQKVAAFRLLFKAELYTEISESLIVIKITTEDKTKGVYVDSSIDIHYKNALDCLNYALRRFERQELR